MVVTTSLTCQFTRQIVGQAALNSQATITARGGKDFRAQASLVSAGFTVIFGGNIKFGLAQLLVSSQLTAVGKRTRRGTASIASNFTFTSIGDLAPRPALNRTIFVRSENLVLPVLSETATLLVKSEIKNLLVLPETALLSVKSETRVNIIPEDTA
jgi:hypothetical protein